MVLGSCLYMRSRDRIGACRLISASTLRSLLSVEGVAQAMVAMAEPVVRCHAAARP
jgi:hypothetical protein